MKLFFLMLSTTLVLLTMSGCETDGSSQASSQSAIPWNRPASWEGAGMLGAMGVGSH